MEKLLLTGAQELVSEKSNAIPSTADLQTVLSLGNDMLFDLPAIQINGKKASPATATVNVHFTDTNEDIVMLYSNGTLNHRLAEKVKDADLNIRVSKTDFVKMMMRMVSPSSLISEKKMAKEGSLEALTMILSSMEYPEPDFNIVTP